MTINHTLSSIDLKTHIPQPIRLRRNRISPSQRDLFQETRLHPSDFISPFFLVEGQQKKEAIPSLPGHFRFSIDLLLKEVQWHWEHGVRAINLFACLPFEKKDPWGSEAINPQGIIPLAIQVLKSSFPNLCILADVALDPYTSHGHDGVLNETGEVVNDASLKVLAQQALCLAEAGVDIVAPSDMMDGRISFIRQILDEEGFSNVGLMAYAAKYASSFYGPFRDALGSKGCLKGDKKTYQLNPANQREALLEALLDEEEGADSLLVKPALPYLDVLAAIKAQSHRPVGAYHVSGEYAMILAAGEKGWLDVDSTLYESLLSIKRAGADFILTYAARQVIPLIESN